MFGVPADDSTFASTNYSCCYDEVSISSASL